MSGTQKRKNEGLQLHQFAQESKKDSPNKIMICFPFKTITKDNLRSGKDFVSNANFCDYAMSRLTTFFIFTNRYFHFHTFAAPIQGPCWFCLGSAEVEKHLVVSVADNVRIYCAFLQKR